MYTLLIEPDDFLLSGPSRSSAASSIGLEYTSSCRVEADILTRIRSLLSRQLAQSSHTPHSSGASSTPSSRSINLEKFDFKTAKSIAKLARLEFTTRSSSGTPPATSRHSIAEPRGQAMVPMTVPQLPPSPSPVLRNSSSASDLRNASKLIVPSKSQGIKIAIQNAPDTLLTCCSPYDPREERIVMPTPSRHVPASGEQATSQPGFRVLPSSLSYFDLKTRKASPQQPYYISYGRGETIEPKNIPLLRPSLPHVPGSYRSEISDNATTSSPRHIEENPNSPNKGLLAENPEDDYSLNIQSASLPRYVNIGEHVTHGHAHPWDPTHAVSETPSVVSGASKGSARRHALLKPSVTPTQPIDPGLPIQPVLTNVPVGEVMDTPEYLSMESRHDAHGASHSHHDASRTPVAVLANLLNKMSPQDSEKRNGRLERENDHNQTPTEERAGEDLHSETEVYIKPRSDKSTQHGPTTPFVVQYWGFEPDERARVEGAVQEAIQKALHETVIPLGRKYKPDTDPYRKLVADSLAEAVRSADEYLRRPSVWSTISDSNGQSVKIGLPLEDENVKSPVPATMPIKDRVASLEEAVRINGPMTSPENKHDPSSNRHSINVTGPDTSRPVYNPSQYSDHDQSLAGSDVVKDRTRSMFPAQETSVDIQTSPGVMEEVPLDSPRHTVEKTHHHHLRYSHWDPPSSWNAFHFRRSGHKEDTAPHRMSSLERIKNIGRTPKPISPSQLRNSETEEPELNQLKSESKSPRANNLSLTAMDAVISEDKASTDTQNAFEKARETIHARQPAKLSPMEEVTSIFPHGFSRQRTTDWLREVLSNGDLRSRRLTDIASTDKQDSPSKTRISRSKTVPAKSAECSLTESVPPARSFPSDVQMSKNFAGAISNLEHLLSEALDIARRAATTGEAARRPRTTQRASRTLDSIGEESVKSPREKQPVIIERDFRNGETRLRSGSLHESASSISSGVLSSDMIMFVEEGPRVFDSPERLPSTTKSPSRTRSSVARIEDMNLAQENKSDHPTTTMRNPRKISQNHLKLADISNVEPSSTQPRETDTRLLGNVMLSKPHPNVKIPYEEDDPFIIRTKHNPLPNKREVREYIRIFHQPPIQPRVSSLALRKVANSQDEAAARASAVDFGGRKSLDLLPSNSHMSVPSLDGTPDNQSEDEGHMNHSHGTRTNAGGEPDTGESKSYELRDLHSGNEPRRHISGRRLLDSRPQFLRLKRDKSHISIEGNQGFSLSRSHRRQPIARDWSPFRKRFVASVACINTALVGILVGIYAGEVPSIQYYIADLGHIAILGNVFFYIALAIPTLLFWPLPLLHGRKPYILGAMTIAMPLLVPQANCVSTQRSPYVATYRVGLILPRAFMGLALGFAYVNFLATLTDLFGASLMSGNPHQEVVDEFDVRRHGGGLGVWLGIWTWCSIGSIGIGFVIGAAVINTLSPDWGLYISIIIIASVLLLNVITPEVRRSAYRRSVAEVRTQTNVSRRVAKGEVKMHRVQTGPTWWGEELYHGWMLTLGMLRQPGFLVMTFYMAWIYGQIVLVIVLLGALMSRSYRMQSPSVGATTCAIPIGALLAVPFQKASLFSRARHHPQRTDSMTFQKRITWSSHLVRRSIFTLVLPFADLAYTLCSTGPDSGVPWILPVLFAGLIAFLSNLAIAECNGIIMEAFDTSDLQPGMTGRPRGASGERTRHKRTNYSSFPRVSAAFAITQSLGFVFAAGATGIGGVAQRRLGQQAATGVMAAILLVLTLLLLAVLFRWKEVQIIPTTRTGDMERWQRARQMSLERQRRLEQEQEHEGTGMSVAERARTQAEVLEVDEAWRPVIIGNPSGKFRRVSILELGGLTRWSEIRRKNLLIDAVGLESRHPNLAALGSVRGALREGLRSESLRGSFRGSRDGVGSKDLGGSEGGIEMRDRTDGDGDGYGDRDVNMDRGGGEDRGSGGDGGVDKGKKIGSGMQTRT